MNHEFARATVAACLLAVSAVAVATDHIETITVTASRTPTLVNNAGSAISLVTHKQIQQESPLTLADLLSNLPGVAVSQQGGVGTLAQVRMRGAEANQVLVLIDGIEANDVAQGSDFNFAHVMADNIRRVEVVRGPQSALWGADALAGVINVITDSANAPQGATFSAHTGSHNSLGSNLSYDTGWQSGSVSINLSQFHTAGTNISRTGSERDGYSNKTVDTSAHLDLSDRVRLTALWRATNAATDFDGIDFVNTGLPVDAPYVTDSRQRYGKVSLNAQLGDSVQQIVTLGRTYTHNVNHTDAAVNDTTAGAKNSVHLQTNVAMGSNTLSIVAEHELLQFHQRGEAAPWGDPNKDLSATTESLAAEWHHQGPRIDWTVSGRHDRNSEFANADTWRVTGLVHVTPALGVFTSVGKGVKNPTFTDRFGYFNTFLGNPDLKPEHSLGWELGLRNSAGDADLQWSASYFQSRLENEINGFVFDPGTGLFTARNMPDASHRRGVEFEAEWAATESASLHASYTWLDATQPGPNGPQEEVRRPRNSAALDVNYALGRANLNVGIDYTGPQADDYFPPFPPYQERVRMPGYVLLNLSTRYELTDNVTLTAKVDNLLNKTYEAVYGYREPGIAAYAGVTMKL